MEEKKKIKPIHIIILAVVVILIIVGVVIFVTSTKSGNNKLYNKQIQQIRDDFSVQNIQLTNTHIEDDTIKYGNYKEIDVALANMIKTMKSCEKIYKTWSIDQSESWLNIYADAIGILFPTFSSYYNSAYDGSYTMYFKCNINDIKASETESITKDIAEIIWESLNIIHSNKNAVNSEYLNQMVFDFDLEYKYINDYGDTKNSNHNFSFTIDMSEVKKINFETFSKILEADYTKIFKFGYPYYQKGESGININFQKILVK